MTEISLNFLFKIFKKTWWKILSITVIAMLLAASFTHFVIPKKYSSSIKFYVVNINSDYDYTSSSVVSAASYLINDYIAIIKSDRMLDQVMNALKEDGITNVTKEQINGMISSSSATETSVFTLSISSTDKALAYKVASAIAELAPATVTDIAKSDENTNQVLSEKILFVIDKLALESQDPITQDQINNILTAFEVGLSDQTNCIEVLTPPAEATTHDSPNLIVYTLLGGIVAAAVSYTLFLLYAVLNQNVVTEDDVKRFINRPLIGVIPHWESTTKN